MQPQIRKITINGYKSFRHLDLPLKPSVNVLVGANDAGKLELGLHPFAIRLLAAMARSAGQNVQVILATQSVTLVNQFTPNEVLVVERAEGVSTIRQVNLVPASWLEDYGLGDLWDKSVFGGHPKR